MATDHVTDSAVKSVLSDLLGQLTNLDWAFRVLAKHPQALEAARVLRDQLAEHPTD